MRNLLKSLLIAGAMLGPATANAGDNGRLYIIGDATPYGWELDMAQCLMSTSEYPSVYTGTLYLKGGENNTFKFMDAHEWGGTEYGLPSQAAVNGEFHLASGTLDEGYGKMYVSEDGNYHISIDTEDLTGYIIPSDYQESDIKYCSLFLVGDATDGGWSVEDGTPLFQSETKPYEYSAVVSLKSQGSFKIATALRGACSWNAQYYYFKDVADAGKISTDSTDDRQWSVSRDGEYTVTVNTISNTISIDEQIGSTGIEEVNISSDKDMAPTYYNLQGCKISNPTEGVFIEVVGNIAKKVIRY